MIGAGVVPGICINENKPIFSPGVRIKHTAKTITTTIEKFSDFDQPIDSNVVKIRIT